MSAACRSIQLWRGRVATLAALAAKHAVLLPHLGEVGAEPLQLRDQVAERGIVEMRAAMRAKLGDDAAGPVLPIAN